MIKNFVINGDASAPMRKKRNGKTAIVIGLLAVLFIVFVVFPLIKIKKKAGIVLGSAKQLKATLSKNDIDLLKKDISNFSDQYDEFSKASKGIYWAGFIPYVADYKRAVEAGRYMINAGTEVIAAIEPYADLIGFRKGEGSFAEKSAEDRLQTAVLTLDKMLSRIDPISKNIESSRLLIEKINPDRYPKKIGNKAIRENIIALKEQFHGISSLFVDAKPLIKKLPEIMGADKEKTYLVLFQNDKERRATGGFLTFYTVFKVNQGKLTIDRSGDIYSIDEDIASHPTAPREILTYHKDVSRFYIRDSNISPDFVESVKLFEGLYEKSGSKVSYDGIIALDSKILVDMLTIFGDTDVSGLTFSAQLDKRCDCPQVIYQLFDIVDRPVGYVKENRKGIMGELMYELFYRALRFSPSRYWGTLAQTMYENLQEKHIILNFKDSSIQNSVEKLNFAGKINDYKGDYLHINNVNFAGAKSNMFVSETIETETVFEGNGISRIVTVDYKNPYPHSDCNLERGGLCLNATLRNWVRLYVPKGSVLKSFKGSLKKVQQYDDLGKTVFEGYLEVIPKGKAQIVVSYALPESISKNNYSLLVEKQAGVESQEIKVDIDTKTTYSGSIRKDMVFRLQ